MSEKKKGTRVSDLGDEKGQIAETISANAKLIGADDWEGPKYYRQNKDKWGICALCDWFQFCETEFGKQFAKCAETKLMLDLKDRMIECTMFQKIGQMNLQDMQQIAWYINPQKRKVGF
jgi:hypothetical protein